MTMTPMPRNITGVILAGGKSRRMGQDKSQLPYRGTTLLAHMQDVLQQAGITQVLINNAENLSDAIPGKGPLGGVHAALKAVRDGAGFLLCVPVDMPGLTVPLLEQLIKAPESVEIVRFGDFMLPFRLKVSDALLAIIEETLGGDDYSLKSFQQQPGLKMLPVNPTDEINFANLNTPQDWEAFGEGAG